MKRNKQKTDFSKIARSVQSAGDDTSETAAWRRLWQSLENLQSNARQRAAWKKSGRNFANSLPVQPLRPERNWAFTEWFRPLSTLKFAALALLFMAGLSAIHLMTSNLTVKTGNGQRTQTYLPDGSRILLNAATRLSYPKEFSDRERRVRLRGEAFFAVKTGAHPFIVETENAVVKVLGTEFNVRYRGNRTEVTVKFGKVALSPADNANTVFLTQGQRSLVIEKSQPISPAIADLDRELAWLNGELAFLRAPVVEVFAELTRVFDVKFRFSEELNLDRTLTASFRQDLGCENIVEQICFSLQLEYQKLGINNFVIQKKSG